MLSFQASAQLTKCRQLAAGWTKLISRCTHEHNRNPCNKPIARSFSQDEQFKVPFSIVKPGKVSPVRSVPDHIPKPPYLNRLWQLTHILPDFSKPEIKTEEQIEKMRDACQLARTILTQAGELAREGVTTDEIDEFVHNASIKNNAYPSPLMYRGFPKSVCTSVNNVACHGIPDDRPLQSGDIVNIDVTVSSLLLLVMILCKIHAGHIELVCTVYFTVIHKI